MNTHMEAVADPGGKSGNYPIQFGYKLFPPSNKETNMRYWETLNWPPLAECLDWCGPLAECLDPPVYGSVIKKLYTCNSSYVKC